MRTDHDLPAPAAARSRATRDERDEREIDSVSISPDRLSVRGVDLLHLIDSVQFTAAIMHVLAGRMPDADAVRALDRALAARLADDGTSDDRLLATRLARCQRRPEVFLVAAIAAGLAAEPQAGSVAWPDALSGIGQDDDVAAGLCIVATLPRLLAVWRTVEGEAPAWPRPTDLARGFSAAVLDCLRGGESCDARARLFDVLLVALHGGFGLVAPTIALPRFSASTYASIDLNLIAGLTGSGSAHVGACSDATRFFASLVGRKPAEIRDRVTQRVQAGDRIPGFGHPLLERDPRPAALERHAVRLGVDGAAFDAYRAVCSAMQDLRGLPPNIDSAAAAILLELGVPAVLATPVFLFARMPTMLAHALQKRAHPPFGQTRPVARERLAALPKAWI
ncbi:citrate synthase [Burkholderia multivorans]|uniref:citrate/2-methylcitrate synthase n=1 Tax=Burkholderia multivorans TaxID=87883 RepID=UPI0012DFE067|nr:citrate/2-methylcitrate synthase [Burkholderia multivorans]MBU9232796.1 citrate synthase [Burkholderia multivorans]MBU9547604.1 citrate synthase [Burkholderia multivorans]MBU9604503.1 citrate synthase [Burkholderia multivorans]MBU9622249.1 citrate synthase [Burkholderia multivorans]MBU9628073.1 citrate synthase [Burkholderia multivorans]